MLFFSLLGEGEGAKLTGLHSLLVFSFVTLRVSAMKSTAERSTPLTTENVLTAKPAGE